MNYLCDKVDVVHRIQIAKSESKIEGCMAGRILDFNPFEEPFFS